jgi:hypothetical protein
MAPPKAGMCLLCPGKKGAGSCPMSLGASSGHVMPNVEYGCGGRIRTALVGTKEFLGAHDFHRDIAGAHHDANMRRHLMSSKDSLGPHHELNNIQVGNGSSCHQLFLLLFSTSFVCCHLTILYKGRIPWTSFVVSVRSWACSVSEPRGPLPHEGLWPHGKGDWGSGPMAGPRQKHGGRRGVGPSQGAGRRPQLGATAGRPVTGA